MASRTDGYFTPVRHPGDLDRRVDRLRTAAGQEHPRVRHRRQPGEQRGEPVRGLVGEDLVGVEAVQPAELRRDRVGDLGTAVPDVAIPEAAQRVDVTPPLDIPDFRVGSMLGVDGQRVGDTARDGPLAALVQFSVRSQDVLPLTVVVPWGGE